MKKVICLVVFIFLSFLFVPDVVNAQNMEVFSYTPQQVTDLVFPIAPRALEYKEYYFVQEHERTYEYIVVYTLPYRISKNITHEDYFLATNIPYAFWRGIIRINTNSYILESVFSEQEYSELHFRVTLLKSNLEYDYPDGNLTPFFEVDSRMYLGIDEQDAYQRGFNAGVKSITNKYTSYVFKWTLPFVSMIIISAVYFGFKREWFKK